MDVFDCNRATNCYSNYTKGYYGKIEYVLPTLLISAVVISVHEYVPTHKKEIQQYFYGDLNKRLQESYDEFLKTTQSE